MQAGAAVDTNRRRVGADAAGAGDGHRDADRPAGAFSQRGGRHHRGGTAEECEAEQAASHGPVSMLGLRHRRHNDTSTAPQRTRSDFSGQKMSGRSGAPEGLHSSALSSRACPACGFARAKRVWRVCTRRLHLSPEVHPTSSVAGYEPLMATATRLADRVAASMPQFRLSAYAPQKCTLPCGSTSAGQNLTSSPGR